MTSPKSWPAGWGFPGSAAKAHYFPADQYISLCGKWLWTGDHHRRTPDDGVVGKDDCVVCRRKLTALTAMGPTT
jgi:hypothetical protein